MLSTGIVARWISVSVRPMTRPANAGLPAGRVRHPEDHDDEERREQDLDDDRASEAEAAGRELVPAVGGEPAVLRGLREALRAGKGDQEDERRGDGAADDLGDDVADRSPPRESSCGSEAEGDGRVEVAARDRTERVSAGDDGQTDGERDADEADALVGRLGPFAEPGGEDGRAENAEHEQERSEPLGDERRTGGRSGGSVIERRRFDGLLGARVAHGRSLLRDLGSGHQRNARPEPRACTADSQGMALGYVKP